MSTTIDESQTVVTLINVFDVEPHKQDELVELLERAAGEVMQYLALLRQKGRSATPPAGAGDLLEAIDAVELRVEEAALRRCSEQRAEDGAGHVEVLVDVVGAKLDFEGCLLRVVANRRHHRGVHEGALHAGRA